MDVTRNTTGKKCPHCGYIRKPSAPSPFWQCPGCKKAYLKADPGNQSTRLVGRSPARQKTGFPAQAIAIGAGLAVLVIGALKGLETYNLEMAKRSYAADRAKIETFISKWDDETTLASNTVRISLPPRIAALQNLAREWQATEFKSSCIAEEKPVLSRYTELVIEAMLAFMRNRNDESADLRTEANQHVQAFFSALAGCEPD